MKHAALTCTSDGQPIAFKGLRLDGQVRGLLLEMSVEQRFVNERDQNIEVVYTFPLPWGAVLLDVQVRLGEKTLRGEVVERPRAEGKYEDAIADGDAAILLERNADESYTLNLGNLAAGEACTIRLQYAQSLCFEGSRIRLLIPTTIAPRYGDAQHQGGLLAHQQVEHALTVEYPLSVQLSICGALAQCSISSPSHPVAVSWNGGQASVTLAREAWLDRDFVLAIEGLQNCLAVTAPDFFTPSLVTTMVSFNAALPAEGARAISLKVLVDCSGSMAGDSIDAARAALRAIVGELSVGDTFSLSRFGDSVKHRSRTQWKVTEGTRLGAQRWVSELKADMGGTVMKQALESVYALPGAKPADVLLVTDGEIHEIDPVIAAAKASDHRIFVVGIGSSPAENHLRRLAFATGGACEFVAPGEPVYQGALRMVSRMRSARLTELSLVWPQANPVWESGVPNTVFDGDTLTVYAQFTRPPSGAVKLIGRVAGEFTTISEAMLATPVDDHGTVSRIAAACRCAQDAADSSAVETAIKYQIITGRTSFILVHRRSAEDKSSGLPLLEKIRHMLPAGWAGAGSVSATRKLSWLAPASVAPAVAPSLSAAALFPSDNMSVGAVAGYFRAMPAQNRWMLGAEDAAERAPALDRSDARLWNRSAPIGLTPLGLQRWLEGVSEKKWPKSFAGLRRMGVPEEVVDWLELVVSVADTKPIPERELVRAFLVCVGRSLLDDRAIADDILRRVRVEGPVPSMVAAELKFLAPHGWPDHVLQSAALYVTSSMQAQIGDNSL